MAAHSLLYRSRRLLLLGVCIFCAGAFSPSAALTPLFSQSVMEHDRALGDLYAGYAVDYFEKENLRRADDFAETALLFDPHSPDALFIRAEAALSDSKPGEAADFYSKALLYDSWERFDPREARISLAALHYRSGKSEEAYHFLYPYYPKVFDSLKQARLYTKILAKLNFSDRALRAVRRASGRFPQDEELQNLRVRLDNSYRERAEELILEGDPEELLTKEAYRGVISAKPEQTSLDASRKAADVQELLSMYENRWGEDRFSRVYKTWSSAMQKEVQKEVQIENENEQQGEETELIGEEPLSKEIFSQYDSFTGSEFELLRSAAENSTYDISGFSSFNGEIVYDNNRDGFMDKRIVYTGGEIEYVEWDTDQNTRPEVKVRFSGGEPERVELEKDQRAEGFYGEYPNLVKAVYLSSAEISGDGVVEGEREGEGEGEFILNLVPYEIDYRIFEEEEWSALYPPDILSGAPFPRIDELLFYSSKIVKNSGEKEYTYSSRDGKSEMYSISTPQKSVTGQYEGASLTRRRREYGGVDGMEIIEAYEDGELAYISYDGTGDGRAEYMEVYEEEELLRLWDIDEDGVFDYEMRAARESEENEKETE